MSDAKQKVEAEKLRGHIIRLEAEIERLRAYAKHERSLGAEGPMIELMNAKQEIEQLRAQVVSWCRTKVEDQAEIERLRVLHDHLVLYGQEQAAEIERLRAVLRPLLEHYLDCYDGNEDQLAKDARAALEGQP